MMFRSVFKRKCELIHLIKNRLWKQKQANSKEREEKGYSESGSLNYPWMVSLAGDMDVLNPFRFGLFDRGWKAFQPEYNCEME